MLGMRMCRGVPAEWIGPRAWPVVEDYRARGLLRCVPGDDPRGDDPAPADAVSTGLAAPAREGARVALTDRGRLFADGIVTDLLVAEETGGETGAPGKHVE